MSASYIRRDPCSIPLLSAASINNNNNNNNTDHNKHISSSTANRSYPTTTDRIVSTKHSPNTNHHHHPPTHPQSGNHHHHHHGLHSPNMSPDSTLTQLSTSSTSFVSYLSSSTSAGFGLASSGNPATCDSFLRSALLSENLDKQCVNSSTNVMAQNFIQETPESSPAIQSCAILRPRSMNTSRSGTPLGGGTPTSGSSACASAPTSTTPVKKSSRRNPWGSETYSDLISVAIRSYPDKQATLQQIYDFIITHYEYFRERSDPTSSAGWKNSIRHNLSLHDRFTKCPKSSDNTKSSFWRINPDVASKPYVRRRACSMDTTNLKRPIGGGGGFGKISNRSGGNRSGQLSSSNAAGGLKSTLGLTNNSNNNNNNNNNTNNTNNNANTTQNNNNITTLSPVCELQNPLDYNFHLSKMPCLRTDNNNSITVKDYNLLNSMNRPMNNGNCITNSNHLDNSNSLTGKLISFYPYTQQQQQQMTNTETGQIDDSAAGSNAVDLCDTDDVSRLCGNGATLWQTQANKLINHHQQQQLHQHHPHQQQQQHPLQPLSHHAAHLHPAHQLHSVNTTQQHHHQQQHQMMTSPIPNLYHQMGGANNGNLFNAAAAAAAAANFTASGLPNSTDQLPLRNRKSGLIEQLLRSDHPSAMLPPPPMHPIEHTFTGNSFHLSNHEHHPQPHHHQQQQQQQQQHVHHHHHHHPQQQSSLSGKIPNATAVSANSNFHPHSQHQLMMDSQNHLLLSNRSPHAHHLLPVPMLVGNDLSSSSSSGDLSAHSSNFNQPTNSWQAYRSNYQVSSTTTTTSLNSGHLLTTSSSASAPTTTPTSGGSGNNTTALYDVTGLSNSALDSEKLLPFLNVTTSANNQLSSPSPTTMGHSVTAAANTATAGANDINGSESGNWHRSLLGLDMRLFVGSEAQATTNAQSSTTNPTNGSSGNNNNSDNTNTPGLHSTKSLLMNQNANGPVTPPNLIYYPQNMDSGAQFQALTSSGGVASSSSVANSINKSHTAATTTNMDTCDLTLSERLCNLNSNSSDTTTAILSPSISQTNSSIECESIAAATTSTGMASNNTTYSDLSRTFLSTSEAAAAYSNYDEDCEPLELELSLELADRIVGGTSSNNNNNHSGSSSSSSGGGGGGPTTTTGNGDADVVTIATTTTTVAALTNHDIVDVSSHNF